MPQKRKYNGQGYEEMGKFIGHQRAAGFKRKYASPHTTEWHKVGRWIIPAVRR